MKKNDEIPTLTDYKNTPPDDHFDCWPKVEFPESGVFTQVDVNKFSQLHQEATGGAKRRLKEVLLDLQQGADTRVEGVGRSCTDSSNAASAIAAGHRISDALVSHMKKGVIAGPFKRPPFDYQKVNGIMAVEKPDGSVRLVINLSAPKGRSFNDGIDTNRLYPAKMDTPRSVALAVESAGPGARMLKKDMKNAYKYIAIRREDWPLQVVRWLGHYFVEITAIFGSATSVGSFDRFHEAILVDLVLPKCDIPKPLVLRTLDDVPVISPQTSTWLEQFDREYEDTCKALNIELAPSEKDAEKAFVNVTRGTIFSVTVDTLDKVWFLPQPKRLRLFHDLIQLAGQVEAPLAQLEMVNGKIQHFSMLIPCGRFFKMHLLRWVNFSEDKSVIIPVSMELQNDLKWWACMVRVSSLGLPITTITRHPPIYHLHYTSDAAGTSENPFEQGMDKGVASLRWKTDQLDTFLAVLCWPKNIQIGELAPDGKSMAHKTMTLELVGVLLPLVMDLPSMVGQAVVCDTDNIGAVETWWKGHSNADELASTLVRAMFHICAAGGIQLYLRWIPRNSTEAAVIVDSFSKGSLEYATRFPTPIKLPKPPRTLMKWLRQPKVDDDLGPNLLDEISGQPFPPPLLGYNI